MDNFRGERQVYLVSNKPTIILWGASGHAKVVADIIRHRGEYTIAGFLDSIHPERDGELFFDSRVFAGPDALSRVKAMGHQHMIIAVGDCAGRLTCAAHAVEAGFVLITAIHPEAVIAGDVKIGAGTVVMAGAIINPSVTIGEHAIINTAASIDHDGCIEDGVHLSPHACLAGQVTVGLGSWIGMGSLIREKIRVGRHCLVGAGSLVLKDLPDHSTAWGSPAIIQRERANP